MTTTTDQEVNEQVRTLATYVVDKLATREHLDEFRAEMLDRFNQVDQKIDDVDKKLDDILSRL